MINRRKKVKVTFIISKSIYLLTNQATLWTIWSSNDWTTSEESDHKPPSIPSARTEVERTMSSKAPTSEETDITDSFISLNASKTHCKNQFWTKKKPPSQDCHATMLFVFSLFFFQTHDSNQSNHAVYSTHVIWLAESAGLHSRAQHDVIFRVIREVLEIFLSKFLSMLPKK